MNKILRFLYSFCAVTVTAAVCSYFTQTGITSFYASLKLPLFTPPNAVFPVVWSALYALMIVSFYIILGNDNIFHVRRATFLFLGQLFLQAVWCYLFFYAGYFLFGLIVIVLLLWTVWMMIQRFKSMNRAAGYLQYPYLVWLLLAAYLNAGVVYLNGAAFIL